MIPLILLLCFVFFLLHQYLWRRRGLPPGPTPIPVFGNLFQLSGSEAPGISIFQKWKDQYGPIFTFYMGPVPFVVLTDYQDIKETIIKDGETYADKYLSPEFNLYFRGGEYGIMDISGDRWREHRKFAVLQLRELGVGKSQMESKILEEAEELVKKLKTCEVLQEDFVLQTDLDVAVGSVINQFLFGYRFDESKMHEFVKIKTLVNNFMEEVGKPLGVLAFTCHGIPPFIVKQMVSGIEEQKRELFGFLRAQIQDAKLRINYEEEHNDDFVEAYLRKKYQREQNNDFESYCDSQLENVCFDIWAAGFDTLTNTIGFLFAYAINYPEMQKIIHQEIDEYLGHHRRLLTMSDKNSLVYFNAFANFLPASDGLPSLFKDFSLVSHVIPFMCRIRSRDHPEESK
ncbi:Protein CBR-CYP-33B1 [Caenorhabditis briggsae]|uniref:Protein CBR-CYP-33B1 n=1 Tax=Caenorhabditis briggsae TaxID=6238 RepID=A8XUZ8_CAEBR|nr:Protein CBR-CYP-33B1 [Caenorhabditis briggsae]CAP36465.2 Protein CBR-CYP-33B1 [Caenorhabditis briggsae]